LQVRLQLSHFKKEFKVQQNAPPKQESTNLETTKRDNLQKSLITENIHFINAPAKGAISLDCMSVLKCQLISDLNEMA
jgi:hypothetical protein